MAEIVSNKIIDSYSMAEIVSNKIIGSYSVFWV